jgi:hypothetical protein
VGEDELEEFLKTWVKSSESSDTHASSSSAPPVPDHGPTNVALAQPPGLSEAASMPGDQFKEPLDNEHWSQGDDPLDSMSLPGSSGFGSDKKWTWAKPPKSNPNPNPNRNPIPTADPDEIDWNYWRNAVSPPRQRPAPEGIGLALEHQHSRPLTDSDLEDPLYPSSSSELDSESDHSGPPSPYIPPKAYSFSDPGSSPPPPTEFHSHSFPGSVPPPIFPASSDSSRKNLYFYQLLEPESVVQGAGSPKELEHGVENPTTSKESESDTTVQSSSPGAETPKLPEDGTTPGPPAGPASTYSNLPLGYQALSTGTNSQPVNLDAINALKGKAKGSGTARDVGNAAF